MNDTPIPAQNVWPPQDLAPQPSCPACGGSRAQTFLDGLTDKVFSAAPGQWRMKQCQACQSLFLDPRPSEASIGRAYSAYYTHAAPDLANAPSKGRNLKAGLRSAYLNARYGHSLSNALPLPGAAALLNGRNRIKADFYTRHLPAPSRPGAKLLDVGCGNGAFLVVAADLGYEAVGLEPDPAAVEAGRKAGLNLFEGVLPTTVLDDQRFDQITLNHVLEHLHHPGRALEQAFALLNPGGRIWLSQPNPASRGLQRFSADWRGLEAPRHLTLMTAQGLGALLQHVGFTGVERLKPNRDADFYFRQSAAMALGADPYEPTDPPGWNTGLKQAARAADDAAARQPDLAETLTVTAIRP